MNRNNLLLGICALLLTSNLVGQSQPLQKPASFKEGGMDGFDTFVDRNLHYPDSSDFHCKQGTIFVRFVVNKNGKLENVCSINSVDGYLEQEAERIVSLTSSMWQPAIIEGEIESQKVIVPIQFTLSRACSVRFVMARGLGNDLFKERKYNKAIEKYLIAYEFDPTDPIVVKNLGLSYFYKRKRKQACGLWTSNQLLSSDIVDLVDQYCTDR